MNVPLWQLRASFARTLSDMYGREVPAYETLLKVSAEVNADVLERAGATAERLGTIDRVTAERHAAIRVGTEEEMRQVARLFAAMGMEPVGFYDLRDTGPTPVPVVSTAFRPVNREELARNPFRVFVSLLVTDDRRFFDADLQRRLDSFLSARTLFPVELLSLADRAALSGSLDDAAADRFLAMATNALRLSQEPVERAWYETLGRVSSVAADIGGVRSTHINHLTPRVLDIDELYRRMQAQGIEMIEEVQGPPRWDGPDVLLRQTSFRALAEPRRFREPDGSVVSGALRVRFGEVEARGIALTEPGRDLYDALTAEVAERATGQTAEQRGRIAARAWESRFPTSERDLLLRGLGYFTALPALDRPRDGRSLPGDLAGLLDGKWLRVEPVVYEDFLPRSAAGIFRSNLTGITSSASEKQGSVRNRAWLAAVLDREVHDPFTLYARQCESSWASAARELGLPPIQLPHAA